MAEVTAAQLQLPADHVLVGSTGRIGVPLPMLNVKTGIEHAAALRKGPDHADEVVEAIMTSDTQPKQIAVEFKLSGKSVRIGGICKGAGMIQPGMSATGNAQRLRPHATMLCFITTDAAIEQKALQRCLQQAVAKSFNRITVDGDMSTNDTVLDSRQWPGRKSRPQSSALRKAGSTDALAFQKALDHVCLELAKMIVRDGEGVSRFVTVRLDGARNFAEADAAARAVANSALVKTSWHGGDPNWGRIIDALGYSRRRLSKRRWISVTARRGAAEFSGACGAGARPKLRLTISAKRSRLRSLTCTFD